MSVSDSKLEKWLGTEVAESISQSTRGWYGPPIPLADVPGVFITGSGDFVGDGRRFNRHFSSLRDWYVELERRLWKAVHSTAGMGLGSVADMLNARNRGRFQTIAFTKYSVVSVSVAATAWLYGANSLDSYESRKAAADPGTQFSVASDGAMKFQQPPDGESLFFGGMEMSADNTNGVIITAMLYDRLWAVRVDGGVTTPQAVTGVPGRYQSTDPTSWDFCGGTFMFPEISYDYSSTAAHNWTGNYINQDGNSASFASFAGLSANYGRGTVDTNNNNWFVPLASNDYGVKAITSVTTSAAASGTFFDWVIAKPVSIMTAWGTRFQSRVEPLMSAFLLQRIHRDACLDFMNFNRTGLQAITHRGTLTLVSA